MLRQLVVNADDLGLHPALDAGILASHRDGIVTSASLLATGASAAAAVSEANTQKLALGLHLAFVAGLPPAAPLDRVKSLAPRGRFRESWWEFCRDAALGRIRWREVDEEIEAQWARAEALGATLDHLDSHQHLHLLPGLQQRVERLARTMKVPLRWRMQRPRLLSALLHPFNSLKTFSLAALGSLSPPRGVGRMRALGTEHAGKLSEAVLLGILDRLPPGSFELGCHPGFTPFGPDAPLWHYRWEVERLALCSERVSQRIKERGISLVTYGQLDLPSTT